MAGAAELPLKYRAEFWLARVCKLWYGLNRRWLEPVPGFEWQLVQHGDCATPNPRAVPPILWAYWGGGPMPLLVERCIAQWRRMHPGFAVHVLDANSLREHLPDLPQALANCAVAKQTDWMRLELLRRYGGIWMDASTILTRPLDWVIAEQARTGADYVGYYLERFTTEPQRPVVESWFMAAPPASPFIEDVQREFTDEVITRTGQGYIEHLQAQGVYEQIRQRIDGPDYLSIHLAMQHVLLRGGRYRLLLGKAEDGPLFLHRLGRWSRTALKLRLLFSRVRGNVPALLKLRGPDRRRLDEYLSRGLYLPDSLVGRFLMLDGDPRGTGQSASPPHSGEPPP